MPHRTIALRTHLNVRSGCFAFALYATFIGMDSAAQTASFNVHKGDEIVGHIVSVRTEMEARTTYIITSFSEFNVVFDQTVETQLVAHYNDTALVSCYSITKLNNNMRDSSHLMVQEERSLRYVHPGPARTMGLPQSWTTARMYYEEPLDRTTIFVESEMKDCPLVATGDGRYTLTMSGGKVNHYLYKDGVLHEILVDRGLVDLVFRRT
ncbi:MAG: hypothetical protein IPJ76_15680 [Flavobacteriales bacterium]|nr:MAG: hypothetical protein IPJ76_15680 [Flavobacteriales bacterium]